MASISLESIQSMDGHQFEELIEALLRRMGYRVEGHKAAADGGIDITAFNLEPLVGGKYIIQCKRQAVPISEPTVRDLYGVVTDQRANKGVIVTNAEFTSAAVKFARGKPLELVNGSALLQLLGRHFETEGHSSVPRLTLNQESLFRTLAGEIQSIREAYDPVVGGATFRQGKSYRSNRGFLAFASEKSMQLQNFTGVLSCLFQQALIDFERQAKEPGFDAGKHIGLVRALVRENLREFLRSFQSAYFVDVPPRCESLKAALLETYKTLFEALFHFRKLFQAVLDIPEKYVLPDGSINLHLDYPDRAKLVRCGELMSKEANNLRSACFVATAVYGSFDHHSVAVLRDFRDDVLSGARAGRVLIYAYANIGPFLAAIVYRFPFLRRPMKAALDSFVHHLERKSPNRPAGN